MKIPTERSESKTAGPASPKRRTAPAASRASLQFVRNRTRTSTVERVEPICATRCAGSAASRQSHHRRGGVSSSAAVRMAFGGHSTEGAIGASVRMKPIREPA